MENVEQDEGRMLESIIWNATTSNSDVCRDNLQKSTQERKIY